jgi:hypothetical protein
MAVAAALVLASGVPLGPLTSGVQTLAGVLLPSATVFLLLLCNDKAVLGPWVNGIKTNLFTSTVVWVLALLSVILTAGVLFPSIGGEAIIGVLAGGLVDAAIGAVLLIRYHGYRKAALGERMLSVRRGGHPTSAARETELAASATWRMPALELLEKPALSMQRKAGLLTLRAYLILAVVLVIVKLVTVSIG